MRRVKDMHRNKRNNRSIRWIYLKIRIMQIIYSSPKEKRKLTKLKINK